MSKLRKVASREKRSAIWQDFPDGPLLKSDQGTRNYDCPHCGRRIGEGLLPDRVWDVVVQCGTCGKLSEFPRLPKGAKIGGIYVFTAIGLWRVTRTLDAKDAYIVGHGVITEAGTGLPKTLLS